MATAPISPPRAGAEDGFGIIEVLVSALIVISISLGLFAAIDAAGRTADTNKARSAASNLATSDQERLRGLPITDLPARNEVRTVSIDNKDYTVRSQGEFVVGTGAGSSSCASSENAPRHLKITSTVTWNKMTVNPVKQDSLRAIPNRSISGLGSMAVDIKDRTGDGLPGVPVTATGPRTLTGTTNAQGCVIFGFVPAGTYNVSFSRAGYVLAESPNNQTATKDVVVAADAIASAAFQYDEAGASSVAYKVNPTFGSSAGTLQDSQETGYSIANALMGSDNIKSFGHAAGTTSGSSPLVNFPFTTGYEAWAGRCESNKPDGLGASSVASMVIPRGGPPNPVTQVREFRLRVKLRRRNSSSTTSTTNYTRLSPTTGTPITRVIITPVTAGCVQTPINVTHVANTSSSTGSNAYATYEAIVPWGQYEVCAQYWASSTATNRGAVTETLSTTNPNGTLYPATTTQGPSLAVTVPWQSPSSSREC